MVAASGGQEALQVFSKQRNFDLVLTDLRMEKIDGMQVLEEVKRNSTLTPR